MAGKLMFGVALDPQFRIFCIPWVKRNSFIKCLKGRDYGSSLPVRYVPKNPTKPQNLQTSTPPVNDLEVKDERGGLNRGFDKVELSDDGARVPERRYIRKKEIITEKMPNCSRTTNGFEDKDKFNDSVGSVKVVGRSYNRNKFVKSEKPLASYSPAKDSEDNGKYNGLAQDVTRPESTSGKVLERSNICTISVRNENVVNYSPPNLEDKVELRSSESNKLGIEYLGGGKNVVRSNALRKELNQNNTPSNLIVTTGPEMKEEIGHKCESNDSEDMEDVEEIVDDLQGEDATKNLTFHADKTDAEKKAVALLATRGFSAVELRKKLLSKNFPLQVVNEVIADFQIRGLLNDCLYAETFSRSRFSSLSWGPRRIQQALRRKGVSEVNAEKALKLVFKDAKSGEDQHSGLGLSKPSLDHLYVQASKQWLRSEVIPIDKRKSRLVQWLQYRGFNWGVINFVMKKLESEYPP